MAIWATLTPEQEAELEKDWAEWKESRPASIQAMVARFRPWKLYWLKSSRHRVVPYSFNENGTMTVDVLGRWNLISMERRVFGIDPDDLEECDLPGPDEPCGVFLTEAEQLKMINDRRAELGHPPLTEEERKQYGLDQCAIDEEKP